MAQPAMWMLIALSAASTRADDLPPVARGRIAERIAVVQAALEAYHVPGSGGWNMFADQTEATEHDTYTTALALWALLDMKRAGLGWREDADRRDRMLRAAHQWLLNTYQASAASPGWSVSSLSNNTADGLSLQVCATLLRAEREVGLEVPPSVLASIRNRVRELQTRPLDFPDATGQVSRFFRDHTGRERRATESVNYLWYPWAVQLTARWVDRLGVQAGPRAELTVAQRALGHLVLDLGDEAVRRAAGGGTFLASEGLVGLAAVKP